MLALHEALGPGVAGGAVLTLAQALLVPNLVVWTSAALVGPGFAVGSTSVNLASSTLGPLPAVPVLGALPAAGPLPPAALALFAAPFAAGIVAGLLLSHGRPRSGWVAALDVAGTGLVAGAVDDRAVLALRGSRRPGDARRHRPATSPDGCGLRGRGRRGRGPRGGRPVELALAAGRVARPPCASVTGLGG